MKYNIIVECATEENARIIALKFGSGYINTNEGVTPFIVFGTDEQSEAFTQWNVKRLRDEE